MIAAATRFKEAWESGVSKGFRSDHEIVEMHEAALGLIHATNTESLQEALDVLRYYDAE